MLTLSEVVQRDNEGEQRLLKKGGNLEYLSSSLLNINRRRGIYALSEEEDLSKAKQYFYNCGLLDAFAIIEFNDAQFTYALSPIGYAMLSDNLPFLREVYAHLSFTDFYIDTKTEERIYRTMEEHVLEGDDGCVFVHTVQQFLLGNEDLVRRNIKIMDGIYFSGKNKNTPMQYDINFFKALLERDKAKCEAILTEMVTPKIHQKRNDNILLKKYISMPALGYAKLAWILGVEVEVRSKLIPKELLPVRPLDHYEIPYDFLKDANLHFE